MMESATQTLSKGNCLVASVFPDTTNIEIAFLSSHCLVSLKRAMVLVQVHIAARVEHTHFGSFRLIKQT